MSLIFTSVAMLEYRYDWFCVSKCEFRTCCFSPVCDTCVYSYLVGKCRLDFIQSYLRYHIIVG